MNKRELLALWESAHGTLDNRPELRSAFLKTEEVKKILQFPDVLVRKHVQGEAKLHQVLINLFTEDQGTHVPAPYGFFSGQIEVSGPTSSLTSRPWDIAENERHESASTELYFKKVKRR